MAAGPTRGVNARQSAEALPWQNLKPRRAAQGVARVLVNSGGVRSLVRHAFGLGAATTRPNSNGGGGGRPAGALSSWPGGAGRPQGVVGLGLGLLLLTADGGVGRLHVDLRLGALVLARVGGAAVAAAAWLPLGRAHVQRGSARRPPGGAAVPHRTRRTEHALHRQLLPGPQDLAPGHVGWRGGEGWGAQRDQGPGGERDRRVGAGGRAGGQVSGAPPGAPNPAAHERPTLAWVLLRSIWLARRAPSLRARNRGGAGGAGCPAGRGVSWPRGLAMWWSQINPPWRRLECRPSFGNHSQSPALSPAGPSRTCGRGGSVGFGLGCLRRVWDGWVHGLGLEPYRAGRGPPTPARAPRAAIRDPGARNDAVAGRAAALLAAALLPAVPAAARAAFDCATLGAGAAPKFTSCQVLKPGVAALLWRFDRKATTIYYRIVVKPQPSDNLGWFAVGQSDMVSWGRRLRARALRGARRRGGGGGGACRARALRPPASSAKGRRQGGRERERALLRGPGSGAWACAGGRRGRLSVQMPPQPTARVSRAPFSRLFLCLQGSMNGAAPGLGTQGAARGRAGRGAAVGSRYNAPLSSAAAVQHLGGWAGAVAAAGSRAAPSLPRIPPALLRPCPFRNQRAIAPLNLENTLCAAQAPTSPCSTRPPTPTPGAPPTRTSGSPTSARASRAAAR
jgi:hypothetical protein